MKIFDLYFSGIVAFQYHPRNPPEQRLSMRECAEVAMEMLRERQFWRCDKPGCECDFCQE